MGKDRAIGMVFAPEDSEVCSKCRANKNRICMIAKVEAEQNRTPGLLEMAAETDFQTIPDECPNEYKFPKGGQFQ